MTKLFDIAQNWLNQDPDAETHAELTALLTAAKNGDEKAHAELQARFSDRLQFGTAGLRGPLQAGSMGMNRVFSGTGSRWFSGLFKRLRQTAFYRDWLRWS